MKKSILSLRAKRSNPIKRSPRSLRSLAMTSHGENETMKIAAEFAKTLHGGEVILLIGELGAGKTTFVRGLARAFSIREPIRSPTFTLMHIHKITKSKNQKIKKSKNQKITKSKLSTKYYALRTFVHVDAYRLRGAADLLSLGLEEYLGAKDTVVLIEWGEKAEKIFKNPKVIKFFHGKNPNERIIKI